MDAPIDRLLIALSCSRKADFINRSQADDAPAVRGLAFRPHVNGFVNGFEHLHCTRWQTGSVFQKRCVWNSFHIESIFTVLTVELTVYVSGKY